MQVLNALVTRYVILECRILALQRLLDKEKVLSDDIVEAKVRSLVQEQIDFLSGKSEKERLEEFLRKFEGPIQ